jgi:hypothetical protein
MAGEMSSVIGLMQAPDPRPCLLLPVVLVKVDTVTKSPQIGPRAPCRADFSSMPRTEKPWRFFSLAVQLGCGGRISFGASRIVGPQCGATIDRTLSDRCAQETTPRQFTLCGGVGPPGGYAKEQSHPSLPEPSYLRTFEVDLNTMRPTGEAKPSTSLGYLQTDRGCQYLSCQSQWESLYLPTCYITDPPAGPRLPTGYGGTAPL